MLLFTMLSIGAAAFAGCCCCQNVADTLNDNARERVSLTLNAKGKRFEDTRTLRGKFGELILTEDKATDVYHTHPNSAAIRNASSTNIDRFGALVGRDLYYYQMSASDQKHGRLGSRSYYWAKDVGALPATFDPPSDAIIAMVDVDYYVDMPRMLNWNFQPYMLYTFCPERAAGKVNDMAYCFTQDNKVKYLVTGGGQYAHEVWSYNQDMLAVTKKWGPIPLYTSLYNVDRRPVGDAHYLVLLTPVMRWTFVYSWMSKWIEHPVLERLKPVEGEYVRLALKREDGVFIATGRVDEFINAVIPAETDSAIAIAAKRSKVGLTLPQVISWVPDKADAHVVYDYHINKSMKIMPTVFPLDRSVKTYQFGPESYDPEAKPSMVPFMTPLIDGCYAPDLTLGNEKRCVDERIINVKSEVKRSAFLTKVMDEFLKLFIRVPYVGVPVSEDWLFEQQNRPTQRRILHEAEFVADNTRMRKISMFQKKEAYEGPNDPRPISTINGVDKAAYSKYIYALAEHLKMERWYAFGKSPKEIAQRVCQVLDGRNKAYNTDFSRFDGRVSSVIRELENMVLQRFFCPEYHSEVEKLRQSQFNLTGYGTFGTKYQSGFARASGSPETAAFNSIANAFVAFLALRMTRLPGGYHSPQDAYAKLGIYGGDDGLTADVDPRMYQKAARLVGQKLEAEEVSRGSMGIKFLARIYGPNVWYGDEVSCCDLPRQLAKFHATVSMPPAVKPVMKLVEKCRAFWYTDRNTPIMGPMVRIVTQMAMRNDMPETDYLGIWNAFDWTVDEQYPNYPRDWMDMYVEEVLPGFRHDWFGSWLNSLEELSDSALSPPLCMEPTTPVVKAPVVVREEVLEPPKQPEKPRRDRPEGRSRLFAVKPKYVIPQHRGRQTSERPNDVKHKRGNPIKDFHHWRR